MVSYSILIKNAFVRLYICLLLIHVNAAKEDEMKFGTGVDHGLE